jgi:hypothetical protein
MAEELLDGADVVASFQQMRGEGMAERMAGDALLQTSLACGVLHGALQDALAASRCPAPPSSVGAQASNGFD